MELSINWWLDRWFGEHWDLVRSGPHQLFLFSLSHRQEYRASHHDITIFHSTFWLWYWTVISFAMEFDLKMPSVRGCYSYSHGYHECQEEKNSLTKDGSIIKKKQYAFQKGERSTSNLRNFLQFWLLLIQIWRKTWFHTWLNRTVSLQHVKMIIPFWFWELMKRWGSKIFRSTFLMRCYGWEGHVIFGQYVI